MWKSDHHYYHPFPFILILILLIFSQLSVHGSSAFTTTHTLSLSCGANKPDTDADGRRWDPDTPYLQSPPAQVSSATALTQDPSLPSPIPYMSARIIRFGGKAVYELPTATGARYFLRLHFYPAPYDPDLDITKSFFSTTANGLTLLSNFSAALTAQALTQSYLIREFSLSPSKGSNSSSLTLTFTPNSNSFAFINAIELVEFPVNNTLFDGFPLTGADHLANETSLNLQTMIRLNVGGAFIPPTNDTSGLTRTWYDDTPYLSGAQSGVTSSVNDTVPVLYRHGESLEGVTAESAPAELYQSWRGMGPDPNLTLHYNLTWDFQVDPGFTYIVRMHFCEMRYSLVNQRVFYVYINGRNVFGHREMGFDVIMWAGGKGVPVYKDFATHVVKKRKEGGGGEEAVITVGLHPFDKGSLKPEFYDAILNGLEIFKIGDSKKGLAGPNPAMSGAMARAEERRRSWFVKEDGDGGEGNAVSRRVRVIGAAASGVAVFGIAAVVGIALCHKKNRYLRSKSHSSWLPIVYSNTATSKSTLSTTSVASAQLSTEAAANCRHFSVSEIKHATKNFDESHVIGVGGFGKVYKGLIDGGKIPVAIKRSNPSSEQGVNEFVTEIEMLSKLRHKHLVSLIGYCEEEGEMILVYDYMARGTLREHLYKSSGGSNNKTDLDWRQRLEIVIGAAKGLHYLHTGAKYTIIHRDVKTTNILLDDKWVAKVSDFGLSKTGPELSHQSHVSTVVKGSFGYLDPEYFKRQKLTEKSDVYSFGVVIFEVLCARPALNSNLPKEQVSLAEWVLNCVRRNKFEDIIDPQIKGTINRECLKKVVDTGVKCLSDHGVNRPSMSDLLWNLESALHLQDEGGGGEGGCGGGSAHKNLMTSLLAEQQQKRPHSDSINMHLSTLSLGEDDLSAMALHPSDDRDGDDDEDCPEIFSQIVHQAGR